MPSSDAQQLPRSSNVVHRCQVNGIVLDVLNRECPPPAVTPTDPRAMPTESHQVEAASDPFVKPGTIYRCRNYSGGLFWSQAHCRQHNALIDRIASVPLGLPFQQQVDIASSEARTFETNLLREQAEDARRALCTALRNERATIWKRSGAGVGYVPPPVLDADQVRWQEIKTQQARNNCGG